MPANSRTFATTRTAGQAGRPTTENRGVGGSSPPLAIARTRAGGLSGSRQISIWCELTDDDHRWLREQPDDEDDGDGAFGRMVADYDSRGGGNVSDEPVT
jgi:hypothetical protein